MNSLLQKSKITVCFNPLCLFFMVLKCIMQFVDRFYVINLCNTEADSIHFMDAYLAPTLCQALC